MEYNHIVKQLFLNETLIRRYQNQGVCSSGYSRILSATPVVQNRFDTIIHTTKSDHPKCLKS